MAAIPIVNNVHLKIAHRWHWIVETQVLSNFCLRKVCAQQIYKTMKQRVCVIGAGASGMAAAFALARQPQQYQVEVWDKEPYCGGVATSEYIDQQMMINDGVQGAAASYRNTLQLLQTMGFAATPVAMKISFGKNKTFWNNYGAQHQTDLVRKMKPEIERFGRVLQWINYLEFIFLFVPIYMVMWLFWFSNDFANYMVYPLTALFFGTGNQTPYVSAAIIARVFLDPDLRLFDYDPELLLSQSPQMFAMPNLRSYYQAFKVHLEQTGAVTFKMAAPARRVFYRKSAHVTKVEVQDMHGYLHSYDKIIFACDAETALKLIAEPTRWESFVLGNVQYFNDITVTHTDTAYMNKHYDMDLQNRNDQYLIRLDPQDASKVEMSFDLSNYQPQLHNYQPQQHIFQTIYLDDTQSHTWTIHEVDKSKILIRKWWRQFAHTSRHFTWTVPFVQCIQGTHEGTTFFAGSYTLFNTHEIATISGLAAAYRLGAAYPFASDTLATKQFQTYLRFIHGKAM